MFFVFPSFGPVEGSEGRTGGRRGQPGCAAMARPGRGRWPLGAAGPREHGLAWPSGSPALFWAVPPQISCIWTGRWEESSQRGSGATRGAGLAMELAMELVLSFPRGRFFWGGR